MSEQLDGIAMRMDRLERLLAAVESALVPGGLKSAPARFDPATWVVERAERAFDARQDALRLLRRNDLLLTGEGFNLQAAENLARWLAVNPYGAAALEHLPPREISALAENASSAVADEVRDWLAGQLTPVAG